MKQETIEIVQDFEFGTVHIIGNIVVAEMKEGIVFDTLYNEELLNFCVSTFGKSEYGYISNRNYSYTVDPTVYLQTATRSNMRAIAVVANNPMNISNLQVEKKFFHYPFQAFYTLEEAIDWMQRTLPE